MNTDTPRTNEALAAILERDRELSEKNAPEVLVKLCRAMECKVEELNHQLARSQEAATIWYRRCFSEDADWNLGELTKLTEERDELRDMLQEEQRLHIQTLNERDEAREQVQQLNHQIARSQEAATIWYRRCLGEDAEWNLGELTKLTDERDELRDLLQEEQRLHIQTLNERDEARQWESQALVARIQRDEWKAKYIQQGFPAIQNKRSPCRPRRMEGGPQ